MKLYNKSELDKAIKSIATRGKRLDRDIQQAAVSVIHHVQQHGDVTVANSLVAAMPKGSRGNALKAYLESFGRMSWNGKEGFVFAKSKTTDMEGATAVMWTEFKPEPEYKPLDVQSTVTNLLTRLERDLEKGVKHDETHVKAIRDLVAAVNPDFEPSF